MSNMIVVTSIIFGGLLCVAMAVIAVVLSRRQAEATVPRCGNCGYNLTGAPSNRCPECGQLFVEAGVITKPPTPSPSRGAIRILVFLLVGFTVLGVLGTIAMGWRVRAARAQAIARQQAAFQAQMLAPVTTQRATTTAPAVEDRPAVQPPETP